MWKSCQGTTLIFLATHPQNPKIPDFLQEKEKNMKKITIMWFKE
jgi:hypothetical protein